MFISFFKILCFTILILLAAVLLLVLLLLFVPFRYELDGSYIEEKINGKVKLSWLVKFVSFEINYHEGIFISGYIRIMGICIFRIQSRQYEKEDKSELSEGEVKEESI